ncbi:NAD-dependent malic enzyme [Acidiferrimicrobium sp. IK]|uniref:NAD-dependent malic enzyme n=1 Tax=Acidiferrimicrobium sp. IK TaxID=2871700 RepID=UPI0021CB7B52|nr:NAD-dependent malic enzyme [Acidiferrimicrobium sp. IK]MCU4184129.1 NAD-dependent malic enzyme [Acidiferrimicrobium sp. IK]
MATALAAYSLRIRARLRNHPGVLGQLATVLGEAGGSLMAIEIVATDGATVTRDLVVFCPSEGHAGDVAAAAKRVEGVQVMEVEDRTFALHEGGKLDVLGKQPLRDRDDLAMAYTPGVARVCTAIANTPALVHRYTMKSNTVAVVTDGTAVLGLGDIGPEAALPVMEGKAVLFKSFAGVDAIPVCLKVNSPAELIETVQRMEPMFGGINLEDIAAPHCFEIERILSETLSIPVFHDDQHGTAVVVLAALRNAAKVVGRPIESMRVVLSGAGAAGVAIAKILMSAGVLDVAAADRKGAIHKGREGLDPSKQWLADNANPGGRTGTLQELLAGADVFVGVSGPGLLGREDLQTMAPDPIVFALANPVPEVLPEEAEGVVAVMATGRSDYPNQINNVLCFPGIFRGALDAGATRITEGMKLAAAEAIAAAVPAAQLSAEEVVPSVFAPGVGESVAAAVAAAALAEGVVRGS